MTGTETGNAVQRRNWNEVSGPKWIRHEALQEASLARIADLLLSAAAPAAGELVLEIGCGTGTLLEPLSCLVGPTGSVTGIDISATMLTLARKRAPSGVALMEADVQTTALGGPYDLMLSRFGVMFFTDPVAAFANLRGALRPTGRLSFVCWGELADNPHWRDALDVASQFVGPPEPREPHAPGPLAFADPDWVTTVLTKAGFRAPRVRSARVPLVYPSAEAAAELAVRMGPAGALITERHADAPTIAAIKARLAASWVPQEACVNLVTAFPVSRCEPQQYPRG
jgi:SAM-dependent methyltransferase